MIVVGGSERLFKISLGLGEGVCHVSSPAEPHSGISELSFEKLFSFLSLRFIKLPLDESHCFSEGGLGCLVILSDRLQRPTQ